MYWKGPTYIKRPTADGKQVQIYQFTIEDAGDDLITVAAPTLPQQELFTPSKWLMLLDQFIETFGRLFSKPITSQNLYKTLQHNIESNTSIHVSSVEWTLKGITIDSGKFIVNWHVNDVPPISIDMPEEESENVTADVVDTIQLDDNIDDITEQIRTQSVSSKPRNVAYLHREKARQRVKEARLNARLAYFRAKQDLKKYEDRYGAYESEYPSSDDSGEESGWSESEKDVDEESTSGESE